MSNPSIENKQIKKAALGRGLGSLLGGASLQGEQKEAVTTQTSQMNKPQMDIPDQARVWNIQVDKLVPNYYQPRQHFDKEKLAELAASVKESGVLQPIVARKKPNGSLEIIAGERRWRAAQLAGLHEVPVIIKNLKDQEALEIAIIENIQRAELNPIEEAEAYQRLMDEFNLTQVQVSEKVGKERATVANSLRLLALPMLVRDMISKDEISAGHAKVLLSLHNQDRIMPLAKMVNKQKLSVRKLEKLVQSENKGQETQEVSTEESAKQKQASKLVNNIADELQKALGTKVQIDYAEGKGKISIQFYSDDELTEISEKIKEGCIK